MFAHFLVNSIVSSCEDFQSPMWFGHSAAAIEFETGQASNAVIKVRRITIELIGREKRGPAAHGCVLNDLLSAKLNLNLFVTNKLVVGNLEISVSRHSCDNSPSKVENA